jgi:SAM-dependent methyltransferase
MWKVNGDYAFHALASGATAVTGIDITAATSEFLEKNAAHGDRVRFLQGDLNDPDIGKWAEQFDVVFCAGVLYHVPDPIFTLTQLRRICSRRLILATASTTERVEPNTAILVPFLDEAVRVKLGFRPWRGSKVGLDTEFAPEKGYGNWFWLPTPSCVGSMVRLAGFEVEELHAFRRVTTVVARSSSEAVEY